MDTVTHGLAGWLLARAIPPSKRVQGATAALVVGAVLPDADNIASLFGSEAYLRVHRGISHGLLGIALTSLVVALLFRRFGRWKDWKALYLLTLLGQLSHIGLDLLNSYGTQIFQPFSNARVAFDVLFIVDLAFSGIIAAGLFLSRKRPRAAQAALAALLLYTGGAFALHLRAEGIVRDAAARGGVRVASSYALPTLGRLPAGLLPEWGRRAEAAGEARRDAAAAGVPFPAGPFAWSGFVDDGATYLRADVDPLEDRLVWKERVGKGARVPQVQSLRGLPDVRTYLWFARFPVVTVSALPGRTVLAFSDLRFGGVPTRGPFLLTVTEAPGRSPSIRWGP